VLGSHNKQELKSFVTRMIGLITDYKKAMLYGSQTGEDQDDFAVKINVNELEVHAYVTTN
jgi:hypothetical protein